MTAPTEIPVAWYEDMRKHWERETLRADNLQRDLSAAKQERDALIVQIAQVHEEKNLLCSRISTVEQKWDALLQTIESSLAYDRYGTNGTYQILKAILHNKPT
jgi:hypothetical protein